MYAVTGRVGMMLLAAAALGGCARGEQDGSAAGGGGAAGDGEERVAAAPAPAPPPPPMTAADSARATARIALRGDSVRAAFQLVRPLTPREVAELRLDQNAEQVATARRMGLRVGQEAEIERLRRQGRLVALGDSTPYWVLRSMEHSFPYVTPDARAMLEELGRRFHARLDSLGLPRFRMRVTSALRTDGTQAELRRTNSYASRTVSAHEFGTTVDVSHERFAAPAEGSAGDGRALPGLPELELEMLDEVGKEHAKALQAELGRAIAEMREQGALHVMMENRQPVYHMTVARRLAARQ